MARSLKTRGLDELGAFVKRVKRQYALGKINSETRDKLLGMTNELEAYVIDMDEEPEPDEGGFPWP